MNAQKLIHILNSQSSLDPQDVQGLEAMLKDYPYFLTPALLLTKYYAKAGDYRYDALLQHTALLAHDREWLYRFMDENADNDKDKVKDIDEDIVKDIDEGIVKDIDEGIDENIDENIGLREMGSNFEVAYDENIKGEEWSFENTHDSEEVTNSLREVNIEVELNSEEELSLKMGRQIEMDTEEAEPLARPNFVRQAAVYDIELYYSGDSQSSEIPIEKGDFLTWLNHPKPLKEGNEIKHETKKHKSSELIDRFIQTNPGISKPKKEFFKPELVAKRSEQMPGALASETLAKIYIQQGNYKGAIEMYERLILKNPQKKPFFAGLIEKIKKEHFT